MPRTFGEKMNAENKLLIWLLVSIVLLALAASTLTIGNPASRLSREYPEATIRVFHGHSPDPSWNDLVRLISPAPFIGPDESAAINMIDLPYPVDFGAIARERVGSVYVENCVISDISALLPPKSSPYVIFYGCDFSQVPAEHLAQLRKGWNSKKGASYYSIGDV